jgi:pimeloyl-ACP methyl ester carboxylesterase
MPDARGHGLSERAGDGFMDHLPDDAAGLIRALAPGGVDLLGFSMGGGTGLFVADRYPELVRSLVVTGYADPSEMPPDPGFTQSEGYQAWFRGYVAWLEGLKTQTHAERMVASLPQLAPGAPLLPEDEYVPWVEDSARLDLNLVRRSMGLWSGLAARGQQMVEVLGRITCPLLLVKSGRFPVPGATVYTQEEPSGRANLKIVRLVNAGHVVHREQFDQFMVLAQDFWRSNL